MNVKILLSTGAAVAALGALPTAANATTCKPPKYPSTGYFTTLTVTKTKCSTGKKVALAYFKCRKKHGGLDGKCPKRTKVSGYKCTETRRSIPTQINARVTCKKGKAKIVHTYQQDI